MKMSDRFRQYLPLLLFTLLAIYAVAIVLATTIISFFPSGNLPVYLLPLAAIMMSVAILFSFGHLGRKQKAFLVIEGLQRSWLSREAVLAATFLSLAILTTISQQLSLVTAVQMTLAIAASLAGLALLLAIGNLYSLVSQLTWSGLANRITPVISAIYLALLLANLVTANIILFILIVASYLADLLTYAGRLSKYVGSKQFAAPSFAKMSKWAVGLLFVRGLLSGLAGAIILLGQYNLFPVIAITFCILLDRFAFFAGKIQTSPEAEIKSLKNQRMARAVEEAREETSQ